ncbi:hypothetical protein FQN57_003066 [Myotisia sp. PD_48]|nr:hypothetical protein FQN57_003066 [Myotisia sp. PD_48]
MPISARPNVSDDLIWEITRSQNAYLVKRAAAGGYQFSRDPLNLVNSQSRKYAGFVNSKAIGVQAGENGAVTVITKRPGNSNQPATNKTTSSASSNKSNRNLYKGVAKRATANGYRADLRAEAVARASALRKAAVPKKDVAEKKLRGSKARKAAEKDA